jgi:hypothetical protein
MPELLMDGRTRKGRNADAGGGALCQEIGRPKVVLDGFKK